MAMLSAGGDPTTNLPLERAQRESKISWLKKCSANEWARQGSNLRPIGYEPTALPLSYEPNKRQN